MAELQAKKQDLIYFQLEPIEHPNFKYPTMDAPRIAMAFYPKDLRDKGRDFTNTLVSEHTVLQYYDDLVRDSVYFFHNQSYIFYQNFTSNLDVNMASMNLKGLMVYGIQFVKEKFLVVYGDRNETDKGLGVYPCTLIKYYTQELKKNDKSHLFDELHKCVQEHSTEENPQEYARRCFDLDLRDTKYINTYRLPNDLSLVLEVNVTRSENDQKQNWLVAYRWDEDLQRLSNLVETPLDIALEDKPLKTHARYDSSDFFIHIIEQPTNPAPKLISKNESDRDIDKTWLEMRSKHLSKQRALRFLGLLPFDEDIVEGATSVNLNDGLRHL